ncbi:MAG: SDR family oxidoreductase [Microbacteriaceae bacterium]|nr:SDR family oxidoreductase [Microbacteriaceae bacterium]
MSTASEHTSTPIALVTGATSGIGHEIVRDLARTHVVYAVGRDAERLAELGGFDDESSIVPVQADVNDPQAVAALVAQLDRLDVLVHSAGVVGQAHIGATPRDEWMRQLTTNVVAPAELTRLALPMLRTSRGTIVFIGSGAGTRASANLGAYAATKHALRALADSLRLEESAAGVRVSTVAPGPVDTPMQEAMQEHLGNEYVGSRYVRADSVARAVRFVVDAPADAQITDLSIRPRA